jgi:hypothetical protein
MIPCYYLKQLLLSSLNEQSNLRLKGIERKRRLRIYVERSRLTPRDPLRGRLMPELVRQGRGDKHSCGTGISALH